MKRYESGLLSQRRILIVLRNLKIGGAERQAVYLASFLKNIAGADVRVLAFFDNGPIRFELERKHIPLTICSPGQSHNKFTKILRLVRFVFHIRKQRPEIIMPFTDYPNKVCGALWKFTGAKSCIWNQRDEGREVTGKFLENEAIKNTPLFVANSLIGKNFLIDQFKILPPKIRIIPNGVMLADPKKKREIWRMDLKCQPDQFCVGMVANLQPYKDHSTLLKAWDLFLKRSANPKSHPILILAGRWDETYMRLKKQVEEMAIGDSVCFLGEVSDIAGLLEAMDLAVFSSKNEGCPNAVLEYMLAQKPVVATRIVGTEETLGKDYPYLVPPDNPQALAEALFCLYNDPALQKEFGKRNRSRVVAKFSMEDMVQSYYRFLVEILK